MAQALEGGQILGQLHQGVMGILALDRAVDGGAERAQHLIITIEQDQPVQFRQMPEGLFADFQQMGIIGGSVGAAGMESEQRGGHGAAVDPLHRQDGQKGEQAVERSPGLIALLFIAKTSCHHSHPLKVAVHRAAPRSCGDRAQPQLSADPAVHQASAEIHGALCALKPEPVGPLQSGEEGVRC